jgi:hypothetical protein
MRIPAVRGLSSYEMSALGIEAQGPVASRATDSGVRGVPITGEQNAPALEVTEIFDYQSYFDDTLLEAAILPAAPNEPIIQSTLKQINLSGYAVGLHPSSETPVAVRLKTGAQQGASPVFRLKPGQVLRPHGRPNGKESSGQFSGVEWGLPAGWLGGGAANLIIFRTADAVTTWVDHAEVAFYRTRMTILAPANVPTGANSRKNWPGRFPWAHAKFGTTGLNQRGRAALSLQPTRTLFRLRKTTVAAATDVRVMFVGADVLAQDGNGDIDLTDVGFFDMTWGTFAPPAGAAGVALAAQPTQILTGQVERISCNNGALVMMALGAELEGSFVDVVRYGKL